MVNLFKLYCSTHLFTLPLEHFHCIFKIFRKFLSILQINVLFFYGILNQTHSNQLSFSSIIIQFYVP